MDSDVRAYVGGISSPKRRSDAEMMVDLLRRATGEELRMWGTIVGFGRYHYKYASGREGDSAAAGFAARKAATTLHSGQVAEPYRFTHRWTADESSKGVTRIEPAIADHVSPLQRGCRRHRTRLPSAS